MLFHLSLEDTLQTEGISIINQGCIHLWVNVNITYIIKADEVFYLAMLI